MTEIQLNDREQLGTLWRLRGKLTLRQFSRERGRIIGAALVLFLFGPLVLGAAFGTAVGYRRLEDQWPTALLGAVLTVLWLIWLIFPIIFTSINEGADITRLLMYPIKRRTLISAVILGTLFDYPTYLMIPMLLAIFYGFGLTLSPVALVVVVALVLSYGHLIMIGQLVGTAVGGIFQSRRLRDVMIVFFSLLGGMCYFINIGVQRLIGGLVDNMGEENLEALSSYDPLKIMQWLPPGATARAIERALQGDYLLSLAWLIYSLAWLALIIWAWYKLLLRLTTGDGYLLTSRPREEVQKKAKREERRERHLLGWLPPDIAELTAKEFKSVWRIPQRRVGVIQGVFMPIFFLGAFFLSGDVGQISRLGYPAWFVLMMPVYAMFLFWANTQNMLAWEGEGFSALVLTPIERHDIFRAKGVALFVVTSIPLIFFGTLFIVLRPGLFSLAGLLTALCMGLTTMAVTAVGSVIFPIPVRIESRRNRSLFQSGGNTKTGCAYITIIPISVLVLSVPVGIPLLVAYWQDWDWFTIPGLIVSAAYGFVIFWYGTRLAGNLMSEREPELVEQLKLPED